MSGGSKRPIRRLLLVEDEALIALDTECFLEEAGFAVVATVDRAADAAAVLAAGPVDLVITDMRLAEGGSGLDVARGAREAGVPVLLVTGACPQGAAEGAIGCLAKPYSHEGLLKAIAAIEARLDGEHGVPAPVPPGLRLYEAGS